MTSAAKPDLHLLSADAAPLLPWAGAVEDFLEDLRLARKQPSYLRYYRDVLVPFGEFTGELPPDQVGERDVRAFLARVAEVGVTGRKGVGARRQNGLRDGLFRFFKWLQKHGYVGHNPVEIIPKATVRRRIIRTFTKEQLAALFAQPDTGTFLGLRDRLLIDLLFGTGLRLAEALGLKVGDVDLEAGRMRVIGKGGGEALVGLSPTLRREFRHFLRQRGVALEAHGLGGSCWLFPSEEGGRLTSRAVQKAFLRYGRAAGIQGVRCSPHTLRHTYAVFLWRQCHDLETVRRALRHSDVRTTQRYLESLGVDDVAEYVRDLSPLESMDLPPLAGRRMRGSVLSDRGRRGRES